MEFADKLKEFCTRLKTIKAKIKSEEATKTSIIMPFFSLLGYDVFNPLEFVPEYTADVGIKKGEKVDYAIMDKKQNPIILVEAKCCDEDLGKHGSQLFRYFATTSAKFAILTNGIISEPPTTKSRGVLGTSEPLPTSLPSYPRSSYGSYICC